MIVTKVKTSRYRVLEVLSKKAFMKFKAYKKIRKKVGLSVQDRCFCCNRKFTDKDDTYLVVMEGTGSKLFCEKCAIKAMEVLENDSV